MDTFDLIEEYERLQSAYNCLPDAAQDDQAAHDIVLDMVTLGAELGARGCVQDDNGRWHAPAH